MPSQASSSSDEPQVLTPGQEIDSNMAPKKNGSFQNRNFGYDNAQVVDKTNMPQRIKCNACKRTRLQTQFSNKHLNEYSRSIGVRGAMLAKLPECFECVGLPKTEMTCEQCDMTYGLDDFSKAQRKNPDHAKCMSCVQSNLDQEPSLPDALEEQVILDSISPTGTVALGGLSTMSSITASLQSTGSSNSSNVSTHHDDLERDGVWIPQEPIKALAGLATPAMTSGRRQHDGPSSPSSDTHSIARSGTDWDNFYANQPGRPRNQGSVASSGLNGVTGGTRGTNPGFANIRAVKKSTMERALESRNREQKQTADKQVATHRIDDEDDDSDWEL